MILVFFFFNDTATTEIYTLSLHDALPIYFSERTPGPPPPAGEPSDDPQQTPEEALFDVRQPEIGFEDRKSTRLNSSHANISYAVFCLKKKNNTINPRALPRLIQYLF